MAEYVGLGVQPPNTLQKLSAILGMRQQRALTESAEQSQRQRANLAAFDYNQLLGEDGTFDLNKIPLIKDAAGDQYPEIATHLINAKSAQVEAKSRLLNLNTDQLNTYRSMVGGLLQDPDVVEDNPKGRQKVNDVYMHFGDMYGKDALPVLDAYAKRLQNVPQGKLADAISTYQMQANDAGKQLEAQRPNYLATGGEVRNVNPYSPGASPTQPIIPMGIPPGFHVVVDQRTQNPYLLNEQTGETRDFGQGFPGQRPGSRSDVPLNASPSAPPGASAKPPASMPRPFYPGQPHDIQTQQIEVANTRAAADAAPANRNIFQHILKLADETNTGPLVSFLQNNAVGGQVFGDNYQELGKYLEKNAIANMQAMGGPPSDARLSAAVAANGSTKFNPKALKAVTQFNYATNTGLERYRQGLDKAIGLQEQDYSKLPQFKADWAKNFDIDAFRLENAVADGDAAEQKAILDSLSPARRKEVARKMKNLDTLSDKGSLR